MPDMSVRHFFVLGFEERRSYTADAFACKVRPGQQTSRKRRGQWTGRSDHRTAVQFDTKAEARTGARAFLSSEHAKDWDVKVVRIVEVARRSPMGRDDVLQVVDRVVRSDVPLIERVGLLDDEDLEDSDAPG